jgi:hypothetical protein
MIRRYAFWWFTSRDRNKPSGRDWARQLGISHTWLQKLVRGFEENPDKMRRLQVVYGDPSFEQLTRAREHTQATLYRDQPAAKINGEAITFFLASSLELQVVKI